MNLVASHGLGRSLTLAGGGPWRDRVSTMAIGFVHLQEQDVAAREAVEEREEVASKGIWFVSG